MKTKLMAAAAVVAILAATGAARGRPQSQPLHVGKGLLGRFVKPFLFRRRAEQPCQWIGSRMRIAPLS